jgi:hypothetical protein
MPARCDQARAAPPAVTPARPPKRARLISSFTFPHEYSYNFDDQDDMLDAWFSCNWIIMKKDFSWGYLKGNSKTLSNWVFLRPDVEEARRSDNLTTNDIFEKGTKDVHYFYDKEVATEYFKLSFAVNGVRCVSSEEMVRQRQLARTQREAARAAAAATPAATSAISSAAIPPDGDIATIASASLSSTTSDSALLSSSSASSVSLAAPASAATTSPTPVNWEPF